MRIIRESEPGIWEVDINGRLDYILDENLVRVWSPSQKDMQYAAIICGPFEESWTEQGMEGNLVKGKAYTIDTEHDGRYDLVSDRNLKRGWFC